MKTVRVAKCLALGAAFGACAASAGPFDTVWLKGTTNADPFSYKPGEEMVFTVVPVNLKESLPDGAYSIRWIRHGDDGIVTNGVAPYVGAPFVYRTKIDKPGFVRLQVDVLDKAGKVVRRRYLGDTSTPEGRQAANDFERSTPQVFFEGSAAVAPQTLQSVPEPEDFDAFWAAQAERLAKVPMEVKRVEVPCGNPAVRRYAVEIACAGIRPVTGYLTVPKAADEGQKFPARLETHGYSFRTPPPEPLSGPRDWIAFNINAHGMKLPALGADEGYYKALRNEVQGKCDYAFDRKFNEDREGLYFNGMVLRVKRALQYLKSQPAWDGRRLMAVGGSQGGLQSAWAAGCGEGVTDVRATVPWNCDIGGRDTLGHHVYGRAIRETPALRYYDPVNFAKRVPATCRFEVDRAGLGDYCCPPSGVAILYNNLKCRKRIVWVQGSQHGYVPPEKYEGRDFVWEENWTLPEKAPSPSAATGAVFRVESMPKDGVTWDLSYEGRDLGIYKSIEMNEGVNLPLFVKDFSKVKYVKHELKLFPERANHSIDMGREIRKPTLEGKGASEGGLHGRVTAIERLTGANAAGDESQKTWREKAWRGERVNCQAVVWSAKPVKELRLATSAFERVDGAGASGGRALPASAVRTRFVRYVVSNTNYKNSMGTRVFDDHLVGDILDDALAYDLPANGFRPFWLTVDVPADAQPGRYRGTVTAAGEVKGEGEGRTCSFVLELEVQPRTLPPPKDWKFFLDLWQTPWAVAQFHQVTPYSDLHYELMKPHLKALADCGQKVITTTICPVFTFSGWGIPRPMIIDRIWKDGRREYDFTRFDRYVELAKECGIGPQIHIYSLITFNNSPAYVYTDGETGADKVLEVKVGDPGYEPHMGPKFAAIERHVAEKGWLDDTYIAVDELPNDTTQEAIKILRKYAPHLKTAAAGQDVDADVFSQGLQGDDGAGWGKHALIPSNYLAKVARRRAEGKITTYYICMFPEKPNAFMDSPLVESRWLGLYAAASGFDGLLRWSVHLWNRDPFYDSSLGAYGGGEPGDRHLMYPRALWSTRMETIRDGIEDFEKIRLLRAGGADMSAIDAALKRISTDDINVDEEPATRRKVSSVLRSIDAVR